MQKAQILKRMSVPKRLTISFSIIIAMVIALGVVVPIEIRTIRNSVDQLVTEGNDATDRLNPVLAKIEELTGSIVKIEDSANLAFAKSRKIRRGLGQLESLVPASAEASALIKSMQELADESVAAAAEVRTIIDNGKRGTDESGGNFSFIQAQMKAVTEMVSHTNDLGSELGGTERQILLWCFAIIVISALLGFLVVRTVSKGMRAAIEGVAELIPQVANAADQTEATSQSIAQATSEQAASLEESAANLEEVSSLIAQNAGKSEQAAKLSTDAQQMTQEGGAAVSLLVAAIGEVQAATDETGKIIKSIDEIAFQTNLLALNAAVEAARAGDAGRGFAVVAEEVRNLAQRSAEATRNTQALIENSQQKAGIVVQVAAKVESSFTRIQEATGAVSDLARQIASAGSEQSRAIQQIKTAFSETEQGTQANAASCEELASTSSQLSSQVGNVQTMVLEMLKLIGRRSLQGNDDQAGPRYTDFRVEGPTPRLKIDSGTPVRARKSNGWAPGKV